MKKFITIIILILVTIFYFIVAFIYDIGKKPRGFIEP